MIPPNILIKVPQSFKWYYLSKVSLSVLLVAFALNVEYFLFGIGLGFQNTTKSFIALFVFIGFPFWIYSVLYYKAISFMIKDATIEAYAGLLSKRSRTIPFTKVHNVDIARGVLSAPFGLSKIRIWTDGDIQMHAATKKHRPISFWMQTEDAEELKNTILSKHPAQSTV
jgi:uncharacterized membrane protein YdbT with pleckstrin-like domain